MAGKSSTNQAKAYALFQGLKLAKKQGIIDLKVVGDSKLLIKHTKILFYPKNIHLCAIISRIHLEIRSVDTISFLHVLRDNNREADRKASQAIRL